MDIRHYPSEHDVAMLEYMNTNNIPYFVVFTKCDKFSKQQMRNRLKELSEDLDISDDANVTDAGLDLAELYQVIKMDEEGME